MFQILLARKITRNVSHARSKPDTEQSSVKSIMHASDILSYIDVVILYIFILCGS